ncbi:MAG: hypothetical protein ABIK62_04770 [candidate division WOR-3 bacterium]
MEGLVDLIGGFFEGGSISGGIALLVIVAVWIGGVIYCDNVAHVRAMNQWTARIVGLLLPIIGPIIYWFIGRRADGLPGSEV